MVEQEQSGLTTDEAELYDRQIRLWGFEAQYRLKDAKILVIGMDGLGAEIVKNAVLTGVKSVILWDDKTACEEDLESQFLIPHSSLNTNRALASLARARALNPLVQISCEDGDLAAKEKNFFKDFSMVLSCNQEPAVNLKLDEICRDHDIRFIATGVYGTFGFAFYDLNIHNFSSQSILVKATGDVQTVVMDKLQYPSLKEALNTDITTPETMKYLRKAPASVFLFKVLFKFEEEYGRRPGNNEEDYLALLEIEKSILEGITLPVGSSHPDSLRCVCTGLLNPVCAIVGAVVAQEAVKIITQKGKPHHNFFFFSPLKLTGHTQYIGPQH